jgi:hypothetical protein
MWRTWAKSNFFIQYYALTRGVWTGSNSVIHSLPKYSSLRDSSLRYSVLRYSSLRYSSLRYSSLRYSSCRYSLLRYSLLRYSHLDTGHLDTVCLMLMSCVCLVCFSSQTTAVSFSAALGFRSFFWTLLLIDRKGEYHKLNIFTVFNICSAAI